MVDYKIFVNNGSEAFGTNAKTISIEEQPRTVSVDFLADAIHSQNELIPKRTVSEVLSIFGTVAARLMAEGLALQFQNDGDVLLRLYADARIKDGNINLARARQLTKNPALTEQEMVSRAGEIVGLAGVNLRAYAEVQQKFNELLKSFKPQPNPTGVVERAYIEKKNSTSTEGGGTTEQQPSQASGPVLTIQKQGAGQAAVTDQTGQPVSSGAALTAGQTLTLTVTPAAAGKTPTATLGQTALTLTEDEGQYTVTFQMPSESATLTVVTSPGDNEGD